MVLRTKTNIKFKTFLDNLESFIYTVRCYGKEGSKMYKGLTIRIYPTKSQEELLRKHIGCCRFIWNHLLGIQQENYKNGGKYISKFNMIKLIPSIKKEFEWLNEVSMSSLQRVCDDLNNSYSRFFKKISNFPKFKTKKKSKLSYPVCCDRFYFKDGKVQIQKLGRVKYKADYKGLNFEKITKFINVRVRKPSTYRKERKSRY